MNYNIKNLPHDVDLETKTVLKKAAEAHRYLAEFKGVAATIPNEQILINTLTLQEAKDSSAIENIITTHDELFKTELLAHTALSIAAKEVQHYAAALRLGFEITRQHKILTVSHILKIQQELEQNTAGFRKTPGTSLVNQQTSQTVYTPPQHPDDIIALMSNLVEYINNDDLSDADPLVKMAIIHHQFESIHPFYDGNGRTGRILNILYLVLQDLLSLPILYLSGYIVRHKADYYRYLQEVRDTGNWENWLLFILESIAVTARESTVMVQNIKMLMQDYKQRIRRDHHKIYSQDLINNLFRHPYTKIEFVMTELNVSRITATRYLDILATHDFVEKIKIGREFYYINTPLFELFANKNQ